MKKYIGMLAGLLLVLSAQAQTVATGEYFIDTDPGFGGGVSFTGAPIADGNFSFSVNMGATAVGFHKLYIRTKDSNGKWSHTLRKDFEVLPTSISANLVLGEYYFDIEPGFGSGAAFSTTPATDGDFPFVANIPAVTGFHKMYIRTRDSNGKWSYTVRRDIEVLPAISNPNVVAGEYFVDTDPGFSGATAFTVMPASDGNFPFPVSVAGVSKGYHKLFTRTKDENGKWGLTARKDIEVLEATPPFIITAGEYFIDTDPGIGSGTAFTFTPVDTNVTKSFALSIGCTNISMNHQIFFRVKDSKGDWSSTASNSFQPKDSATVTTVSTGLWSNPAIWSNGIIPTTNTKVILNHNITVDVDAACYLLRTNCHSVTVTIGKKLVISGLPGLGRMVKEIVQAIFYPNTHGW